MEVSLQSLDHDRRKLVVFEALETYQEYQGEYEVVALVLLGS